MGIREEVFWRLNPKKLEPYIEAERLKTKERNFYAWLDGFYVNEAFAVVIANAFGKKGSKKAEYPKEPHEILPPTEAELEQRAEIERQKTIQFFNALAKKHGQETI